MKHMPPVMSASVRLFELDLAVAAPLIIPTPMMTALSTRRIIRLERLRERTSLLVEALERISRAVRSIGVDDSWAAATEMRRGRMHDRDIMLACWRDVAE